MTGIWSSDGSGWKPLFNRGFAAEARLRSLVEERVDGEPSRSAASLVAASESPSATGRLVKGAADFEATIEGARPESREDEARTK